MFLGLTVLMHNDTRCSNTYSQYEEASTTGRYATGEIERAKNVIDVEGYYAKEVADFDVFKNISFEVTLNPRRLAALTWKNHIGYANLYPISNLTNPI